MSLVREIPIYERPRERLELLGASSLSIAELLAIIIRTGTKDKSSIALSYEILKEFEDLESLSKATLHELCKIKGIEKAKAISIIASLELGKRMASTMRERIKIKDLYDVYDLLSVRLSSSTNEELNVIYLNIKGEIIKVKTLSIGTINKTLVDAKDIIKWAIRYSSNHFIMCHNHPSGNATPSKEDALVTKEVDEQAKMMGIKMLDHVIIGKGCFFSFSHGKLINVEKE